MTDFFWQVIDAADLLKEAFSLFDAIGLEMLITKVRAFILHDKRPVCNRPGGGVLD